MRKLHLQAEPRKGCTLPPSAPDVSWLSQGLSENQEEEKDKAVALILMPAGTNRDLVSAAMEKSGYHVEYSERVNEAMQWLKSSTYSVVVLHSGFEKSELPAESKVYNYLAGLPMERRRHIFLILAGPAYHTYYKLEALSLSANLVVNDADLEHLSAIFKISYRDYVELFGPLLQALNANG